MNKMKKDYSIRFHRYLLNDTALKLCDLLKYVTQNCKLRMTSRAYF